MTEPAYRHRRRNSPGSRRRLIRAGDRPFWCSSPPESPAPTYCSRSAPTACARTMPRSVFPAVRPIPATPVRSAPHCARPARRSGWTPTSSLRSRNYPTCTFRSPGTRSRRSCGRRTADVPRPRPFATPKSRGWLGLRSANSRILRSGSRSRAPTGYRGPAFEVDGLFVWGFTAGVLAGVLEMGGFARAVGSRRRPADSGGGSLR